MKIIPLKSMKAFVTEALKTYTNAGTMIHIAVVSGIYHAAKTGDPVHINRVFSGLRSNDQQAVRLYIRRISAICGLDGGDPEGLPAEKVNQAVRDGSVLAYEKGEFRVIVGHDTDQAKRLAKLCQSRFISPDGKRDRMVLDRNNFAEVKTLGDQEALAAVIKAAEKGLEEGQNTKNEVSEETRKYLETLAHQAKLRLASVKEAA